MGRFTWLTSFLLGTIFYCPLLAYSRQVDEWPERAPFKNDYNSVKSYFTNVKLEPYAPGVSGVLKVTITDFKDCRVRTLSEKLPSTSEISSLQDLQRQLEWKRDKIRREKMTKSSQEEVDQLSTRITALAHQIGRLKDSNYTKLARITCNVDGQFYENSNKYHRKCKLQQVYWEERLVSSGKIETGTRFSSKPTYKKDAIVGRAKAGYDSSSCSLI